MTTHFRQGDILIVATSAPITAPEVPPTDGRHVLALGEATGHHHSIPAVLDRVRFFRDDGVAVGMGGYLAVEAPVQLEHQEHAAITIPAGTYEVRRQVEYSPQAIRAVMD